jgi:DNA-binding transcriptional regulator LsrR (DeoR family)
MNNYSQDVDFGFSFSATPASAEYSALDPLADDAAAQNPAAQNLGASFLRRERCPVRLIAEVAQLYHEERCTQNEIANKLRLSQGTVCRMLKKAQELGIVRTTVIPPEGTFVDLEELLEDKFGLTQVIIARAASDSEESIQRALGAAAAHFLEATLKPREVIGVPSWSATLLSMVEQMRRIWKVADCQVVQILGGLGDPSAEEHPHHLVTQLAKLVQGEAHFLAAPGIVGAVASASV